MHRYEVVKGNSSKFWQYEVQGSALTVEYGRIGGKPRSSTKTFASPEEAQRAAAKLVKEKTGKGYVGVGAASDLPEVEAKAKIDSPGPEAKVKSKSKSNTKTPPPPSSPPQTTFRTLTKEIDLTKVKVRTGADHHSPALWPHMLWAIVEAGLLKRKDALSALTVLAASAELGSPLALLTALQAQPKKIKEDKHFQLLENYTLGMDTLLIHLAHRAPELLLQQVKTLPANIRRALPLVQARLGQATTIDEAWMDEFAASYARGGSHGEPLVMLRGEELVNEQIDSGASARDLAAFYGDVDQWGQKVRTAAVQEDGTFRYWSRTRPFFLQATVEELARLTSGPFFADDHLLEILSLRSDSDTDLIKLLKLQRKEGEARCNLLAAFVAEACRATKTPLPSAAVQCLTFELPSGLLVDSYIETLRELGQKAVLKRAKTLAGSSEAMDRDRAAVALGAFYDDGLYRKLLAHPEVSDQEAVPLALVGRAGLEALSDALSSAKENEYTHRFLTETFTHAAARAWTEGGYTIPPEWDTLVGTVWCAVPNPTREVLISWPPERRHAWMKANLEEFSGGVVINNADLASTELIEAAISATLQLDSDSVLASRDSLEAAGEVVVSALLRRLARMKGNKKLLQLLDWMQLSDVARAEASRIVFNGGEQFVAVPNEERIFSEETAAALLVGRQIGGPKHTTQLRALCAQLDALSQELRVHAAIVIGADMDNTPEGADVHAVIGIEVQRADTRAAQEVDLDVLGSARRAARAMPWARIEQMLPSGWSADDGDASLFCIACGPLAVAKLAFGELLDDHSDEDEDHIIYGVAMGQEQMTASVRGLLVASSSYDGETLCPVELSSPPFKAERKKLGHRAKSAAGVLIASYDA